MIFRINNEKRCSSFLMPSEIADKHIKLAGALQLRVIILCCHSNEYMLEPEKIAEILSCDVADITDAMMFWKELGILSAVGETEPDNKILTVKTKQNVKKIISPETIRPDRKEVARRGTESPEIAFLLNEAQKKFGRMLKQSESSAIVWMYDDLGMKPALVLMVLEYAFRSGKINVTYIERVAKDWTENGVESVEDAEKRIVDLNNSQSAWNIMRSAFGLDSRAPSDTELKFAKKAVIEWMFSSDILKSAYNICIDSIGKYKLSYIKTILTKWQKSGVKTREDIEKLNDKKSNASKDYASYDLSLADKIINGEN